MLFNNAVGTFFTRIDTLITSLSFNRLLSYFSFSTKQASHVNTVWVSLITPGLPEKCTSPRHTKILINNSRYLKP